MARTKQTVWRGEEEPREEMFRGPSPDPYDQAMTDLDNKVATVIGAGNQYLAAGEWDNAVDSYKAAGDAGANSVGPEIDLAGAAAITQPTTQQAWQLNAKLAAVNSTSSTKTAATQPDALLAQETAQQMLSLYGKAIADGQAFLSSGKTSGERKAYGVGGTLLTLFVIGAGLGLAYAGVRHYERTHGHINLLPRWA